MISTPYHKYQQSYVQTASPIQLTIMLYEGAIRFIKQGIEGIEKKDYEKANLNLIKAQQIIHEFIASLNHDYPISKNLLAIYDYSLHNLIQANIKKDKSFALEVLNHLSELKEAWHQIAKPSITEKAVNNE